METSQKIVEFEYGIDGTHDTLSVRSNPRELSRASRNLVSESASVNRPVRAPVAIPSKVGARLMFPANSKWVGLADVGGQAAGGTIFSWIADMLLYAGFGQVVYNGENIPGEFASSLLKILLRWGGSYTAPESGSYFAGTPQPSAPAVGVIDSIIGGTPVMDGAYSFRISWIKVTGGRSIASPASVTIVIRGKCAYLVFPLAPVGAEVGVVWTTKKDFGERGLHYRLVRANPFTGLEYTARDIQRTFADMVVTNGSNVVTTPSGDFSSQDVGKRFAPVSSGFSVPAGTLITGINSPTEITLSNNVTVTSGANPRTADIISYAAGIDRSVILNWRESDLSDELYWIEDLPPEPFSHVFPLEKVVGGISDADSLNSASGENRGTVARFSLRNLPESWSPLHELYLPSSVVDIIWRGQDSYVFIGCEDFIGAIQYIDVLEEAPATLTTVLADEGILSRNNWCISESGLYLITAKGKPTRITEGGAVDTVFGDRVRAIFNRWLDRAKISVASYADGVSISWTYGNEMLLYNKQTGIWSALIYLNDFVPNIDVVSSLGVGGRLLLSGGDTTNPGAAPALYDFDSGGGSTIAAIPHYQSPASDNTKSIDKLVPYFRVDRTDKPVFVSLHINDEPMFCTDGQTTAGGSLLLSNQITFDSTFIGKYVLVLRAGPAGGIMRARIIEVTGAHSVRLGTCQRILADCIPLTASNSVNHAYVLFAHRIYQIDPKKVGDNFPRAIEPFINGVKNFAVGMVYETAGIDAVPLKMGVCASINPESNWNT